jgi:prepilin-type N-terminal cleavage/methylation domain-containing protein
MARTSQPLPVPLPPCPDPRAEAGFTLIEVLAALTIASLVVVMSFQLLSSTSRISHRVTVETSARDLARTLLAENRTGAGEDGTYRWQATLSPAGAGLNVRQVQVGWKGGGMVTYQRLESAPDARP